MKVRISIAAGVAGLVLGVCFLRHGQRMQSLEARVAPYHRDVPSLPDEFAKETLPPEATLTPATIFTLDEPAPVLVPPLAVQSGGLEWEARIEKVTSAPGLNESAKAKTLLAMLNSLPPEALETAAREAGERLPDSMYASASAMLLNPKTHGRVLGVLFEDLLVRPDAVALPALLALARNPAHPFATAARENLELLLGKNFGNEWPRWSAEIRRALNESGPDGR